MASVIRGSDNFDSLIHQGLGVNQTWQNVTASRSAGVTYTNTTGKPIGVVICANSGNNNPGIAYASIVVNGLSIGNGGHNIAYPSASVSVIIPNGSTYLCPYWDGVNKSWFEVR